MPPTDLPAVVRRVQSAFADLGCSAQPEPLAEVRDRITGDERQSLTTSHLYRAGAKHCLVLVRAGRTADPVNLGGILGEMDVTELRDAEAARWSGQNPGGIAPLAIAQPVEVILDVDLARYTHLWVPAGHPDWVIPTNYAQLLSLTAGSAGEVGELPERPRPPTMRT